MEFYEAVRRRRMVRNYLPGPIDADAVARIVDAGRRAPSAGFSQGQSFVVVTDSTTRTEIARIANEPEYTTKGFDPWISVAPVHVVVCVSEAAYRERYSQPDKTDDPNAEQQWPVPYWWVDAGASLMAILLASVAEGLSAGFLGVHAMDELGSLLGIPDAVSPIGVVTIGHSAPDRRSGSLERGWREDSNVIHHERWSASPSDDRGSDRPH